MKHAALEAWWLQLAKTKYVVFSVHKEKEFKISQSILVFQGSGGKREQGTLRIM